jgi:hypothetical protein
MLELVYLLDEFGPAGEEPVQFDRFRTAGSREAERASVQS